MPEKSVAVRTSCCAPPVGRRRCLLSKHYVFQCVCAGVPRMPYISNDIWRFLFELHLHRCSRAMNCMVLRTWRSCMAHNVYDSQSILTNLFVAHVRCFKILLLANVWATFLNSIEKADVKNWRYFLLCQFCLIFQMIFIDFMLSSLDVVLATLQNMQRTCCDLKRSRPPMSTKPHCA